MSLITRLLQTSKQPYYRYYGFSSSFLLKQQQQQYTKKRIEPWNYSHDCYYYSYSTMTCKKKLTPNWNDIHTTTRRRRKEDMVDVSLHHYYGGRRYLSSSSRTSGVLPKGVCPFGLLQIPKDCDYKIVKTKFLKIAMLHHPDQIKNQYSHLSSDKQELQMKKSTDLFMKARAAFDAIVEGDDGLAILRSEVEANQTQSQKMSNEEFE